jgi:lipoprotein-anchoring transpeptidase ErfK/SrfK
VLLLLVFLGGFFDLWRRQKHHPAKSPAPAKQITTITPAAPMVAPPMTVTPPPVIAPSIQTPVQPAVQPPVIVAPIPTNTVTPVVTANTNAETVTANPGGFPRPVHGGLELQVALAREGISPGSVDGAVGSQTRAAIMAFQRSHDLPVTGKLDAATKAELTLDGPLLTTYTVTSDDLARLQPLGKTWLEKSQQSALEYETILELVAEKAHAHPALIKQLNPDLDWNYVKPNTVVKITDISYPDITDKAALVVIHLADKYLEAFDQETNLLVHFPCSIATRVEKRPVGELHVQVVISHPNYTFDPAVFPESPEAQAIGHKLVLPAGPNNPVGIAWVGLDKPGYGIHGTPSPEEIGHTESHGCFRLTNWDAEYFSKLAWIGLRVEVVL